MSEKKASVHWEGAGKAGQGQISTETGALDRYPYGFASRFGDDRKGTNPEEILGAAHAACFTMAFSFAAEKAGVATESVDTTASVRSHAEGQGAGPGRRGLSKTGGRCQSPLPFVESAGRGARDHAGCTTGALNGSERQRLQAK